MGDNFKILKALNTIQGLYNESEIPSLVELISKYDIENVDEIIEDFQEKFINLVEDEDLIDRILELVSSEDSVNNITNLVYVNLNKLKDLLEESLKSHVNENDIVDITDEFQGTLTEFLEDSKVEEVRQDSQVTGFKINKLV